MAASQTASSVVLSRYADALGFLAEKSKALDVVGRDLDNLNSLISNSDDLRRFLASPLVGKAKANAVLSDIAHKAGYHKLTKNFLAVIVQNGRVSAIQGFVQAYRGYVAKKSGEIAVNVKTARPLTEEQAQAFKVKISSALGKNVLVEASVDPSLLGGMVVIIGSHMIDDSVRSKLERLSASLATSSNQNVIHNLKEVI